MEPNFIQLSDTTIYREVSEELLVIQLETGHFYYFDPKTRNFLDHFKNARTVESFVESLNPEKREEELSYLKEFCHFLLKNQIITHKDKMEEEQNGATPYEKPVFLRKGEKTLDEVTFLCP